MNKLNTKGFGAVEILLVLVIVGIFGGVGYYVYQANRKDSPPSPAIETTKKEPAQDDVPSLIGQDGLVNCNDEFVLSIPEGWYAYHLDNEYKQCTISNVPRSDLLPVGSLSGDDIDFVFQTEPDLKLNFNDWVKDYSDNQIANSIYPAKILSKETIKLDNGSSAILIYTEGGHYNTKDTTFMYKKGELGIITFWRSDSKLADQAIEIVKTLN